jgi:hypothetical protein
MIDISKTLRDLWPVPRVMVVLGAFGVAGIVLAGVAYVVGEGIVAITGATLLGAVVVVGLGASAYIWSKAQAMARSAPRLPLGPPTGGDVSDRTLRIPASR